MDDVFVVLVEVNPLIAEVLKPPKPFISPGKPNGDPLKPENPLKLNGLYKKFGEGYKNGSPAEPKAEAAADEPNNAFELRLLLLLELLLDFPELFDFSFDELFSVLSFLSDENVVPVIALVLGVSPGRLKLGKPNNGFAKPIPAKPPNGKNSGGAFDEEVVEVVVAVVVELVELEVDFDDGDEVVIEEAVVDIDVGSINIFIDGKPAANILALNEFSAADDG